MNTKIILLVLFGVILSGAVFLVYHQTQPASGTEVTTTNQASSSSTTTDQKTYTLADVATHNNANDCWLVISNNVYDVTKFIPQHPGGDKILKGCGKDATRLFMGEREHSENNAASYLPTYLIGKLQ